MIHEVEDTYLLTYLLTTHEVEDPTVGIPLAHIYPDSAACKESGSRTRPGNKSGSRLSNTTRMKLDLATYLDTYPIPALLPAGTCTCKSQFSDNANYS